MNSNLGNLRNLGRLKNLGSGRGVFFDYFDSPPRKSKFRNYDISTKNGGCEKGLVFFDFLFDIAEEFFSAFNALFEFFAVFQGLFEVLETAFSF